MMIRTIILILLVTVASSFFSFSQDKSAGKVHGYVFGDYFYMIGADTAASRGGGQYSSVPKDFQGFQFRRLYLYYDHTFDETFAAQFLLEGNDKAFEPGGKHGVFVKTAYLEWKNIFANSNLWFGLIPTPTWSLLSEKVWNYRSIEKTITDFRGLGGATDIGIGLRGKLDNDGMFNYVAMIANGNAQKPENNKYKKYYFSLSAKPVKEFVVEGYVDFEPALDDKNKTTLKGFVAYQSEQITIGVEALTQIQKKQGTIPPGQTTPDDKTPFGISLFAWAPIPNVEGLNAYARFDLYDPDTKNTTSGYKESIIVVGLDYMPIKNVHIMPNLWVNTFSNKTSGGTNPNADVVGRMTFFYIYK
jgi:hypothetical protein